MIELKIDKQLHGSNGTMNLKVELDIKKKDFIILTGASGSGKTTLLRILAGLEDSNSTIKIDGKIWQDANINLVPQKREIGFVFQDYALFTNMSVEQNLLFVKNDIKLANHLLNITELTTLRDRMIQTLSGGQQQRVALCRAMMNKPKILLLDEPLSALDITIKHKLQEEIKVLHKEFGTTTIMVSHDQSEIYKLSNRVITLKDGIIIEDIDTKDKIPLANLIDIQKTDNEYNIIVQIDKKITTVKIPKVLLV